MAQFVDAKSSDYDTKGRQFLMKHVPIASCFVQCCNSSASQFLALHNLQQTSKIALREILTMAQPFNKKDIPLPLVIKDDDDDSSEKQKSSSFIGFVKRSTVHTTTQVTPTQLVFNRNAIHHVHFEADWQFINKDRKQHLIQQNNRRENKKRVPHTYQVGYTVVVKTDRNRKYDCNPYTGPYIIRQINNNGTTRLEQNTPSTG